MLKNKKNCLYYCILNTYAYFCALLDMNTSRVMKTIKTLMVALLGVITLSAFGQQNASMSGHPTAKTKYPEADRQKDSGQHMQASSFVDRRAKKWSVGLRGGATAFHGDADKLVPSWNGGLFLKYSISQTFALRGEYNIGQLKGERIDQGPTLFKDQFSFVSNYHDWNIQAQFTLGNISFLRPLRRTQMYLLAGAGQGWFRSTAEFVDMRLFTGDYYLTHYFGQGSPNPNLGQEVTEEWEGRRLILPFGVGFKHYINKNFDIGIEARTTYVRSDDIDVYNTQIWQNRFLDMYSNLNLTLAYKFGNKNPQHYDWLNPVESIYDRMATLETKVDDLTLDDDNDGVSNYFDKEPDTPEDCDVYGSGKAVDSDGDGIPDCRDKEPFSPRGAEVDEDGVAIDSDGDGVPDIIDREPNTPPGAQVDIHGVQIIQCCSCEDVVFPSVFFSTNADGTLRPEYHSVLFQIAERMKTCPDKKLIISGFGEGRSSKYNRTVNTRRIDAIAKHLNEKYGISRDRIVTDYLGEKNTNTDSNNANRRIDFRFD